MRAVIRKAQGQQQLLRSSNQGDMYCAAVNSSGSVPYLSHLPNYGNSLTNGSSFSGGDFSNLASRMCNKPADVTDSANFSKNISPGQNSESQNFPHSNSSAINPDSSNVSNEPEASPSNASNNSDGFPANLDRTKNCISGNLLQNGSSNSSNQFQQKRHANTMLMSMLSDVPSANPSSSSFPFLGQNESNNPSSGKSRKRKKKSDNRSPGGSVGRSPKRKMSEDDCRSTPDAEMCDSPMGYDASSMPATLPSSSGDPVGRLEFIKTEPPSPGFPQRSTSTDSYLLHEEFQSRQVSNLSESSRMSEGGTPVSAEILRNLSQVKNQYFSSDNIADYEKDYLASSESNYGDPSTTGDIESAVESSFNIDSTQSITKFNSEKQVKKKKSKEKNDPLHESCDLMVKVHDNNSSDESSIGEASQKSFGEVDIGHSEDLTVSSKSSSGHVTQPVFISTSLKIAKSGDGHKVSKSEIRMKQKEGKRSSNAGEGGESSGKRKSDAKKERKRKRAEGSDSSAGRSPVRSLHLNIDSSLMPPPSSSSETNSLVSSSDAQPIRPITLNVKNSPVVTSSSNFQSKSPVHSKKSSSLGNVVGNFSKSSTSKSGSSEKNVKPSPPRSSHSPSTKTSSSDSESKRNSSSVKIQSKHKQSSSSKSSSSGNSGNLHGSGRSSPNKTKTLKLKNYGFPPTVSIGPLMSKTTVAGSPISSHNISSANPSDPLVLQAAVVNPGSPPSKSGSNSSKANKSTLRTRKSSLSAVIDKLRVTATNAQHVIPDGLESPVPRSESMTERKESKLKDNCKDSRDNLSVSKGSESKSKYSSSDQFTVKQSSQGIKLTVTKTRSSDGSSKSKYKQSSKNSAVSSSSSSVKSTSSSGSSISKSGNVSPASKKLYPSNINMTKSSSSGGSSSKPNSSNPQKTSSPSNMSSSMSPRSGISANSMSKSLSKHVSSSHNKISGSSPKVLDKIEKKSGDSKLLSSESKDKISNNTLSVVASLMLPPPSSKQTSDSNRSSSSGNTPKRVEEPSRQSPRHTPTRDMTFDESDGERAFRLLLSQSKLESSNGAEQSNISSKSSEFITSAIDYSKIDVLKKSEADDKSQWVSSSSDIKPPSVQRSCLKEPLMLDEANCISLNEIDCKQGLQIEVSSSGKHDMVVNANLVTSSEEISKAIAPLSKPLKQSKRQNGPSDEDSSPDECLVIDYPDTPRIQMPLEEKWSSPRIDSNMLNALEEKMEKSELSSASYSINQPSLIKSPAQVITPSNHSITRPLSLIDDDLMNEAVMPVEK